MPSAKAIEKTEQEIGKQNGFIAPEDNGPKTGLELIRQKRREKETEDLWELMQMDEDPAYKKKVESRKVQKVEPKVEKKEEVKPIKKESPKKEDTFNAALEAIKRMKGKLILKFNLLIRKIS